MTTEDVLIDLDESTTTAVPIVLRDNCSVYNPCGKNGYCLNNQDNEWTCVCKFWWIGPVCDQMTSSGTQVIVVGVLLFVLIVVFYSLQTYFRIRKKRKNPPKKKEKPTIQNLPRKLSVAFSPPSSPICHVLKIVITIATLLLTVGTLVAKWTIIQPIHDDIVDKFNKSQPLFFKRHAICGAIDLRDEFNVITFPAACLLIVIFSLTSKRVSFKRGKGCKGYIGVPMPYDFFAHVKRTFAAVIFAIFADELLDITNRIFNRSSSPKTEGIIVTYLRQVFKVVVIGFHRYPTLAAIYIDTPLSLLCATLYSWLDFAVTILNTGFCRNDFYPTDKTYNNETGDSRPARYLNYYGTGSKLVLFQLLMDIPRYLCLSYISVKLVSLVFKRIRHRSKGGIRLTRDQKNLLHSSLPHSVESRYVKNMLGIGTGNQPTNRFAKTFRFIYAWRNDFRFSSRIVCVYAAILLLLFFITVQALIRIPTSFTGIQKKSQKVATFLAEVLFPLDPSLQQNPDDPFDFRLPDFRIPYACAITFTLLVTIAQLLTMLATIRRNLLQAFRGDYTEIPSPKISRHVNYVTGNFRFAGMLIGYVTLAFVFLGFISFIAALVLGTFIAYGSSRFIENILKFFIPISLFIYFKMFLNRILSKYVFLQHKLNVLSLNNRRVFMIFLYFNIFLDAFLGIFAAISRLLRSMFGGILYMCRMDYSPLGRKLETKDAGFNAYCGFIHVECAHRHPVLLCFVSHLLRDQLCGRSNRRWSKARNKWAVAVFLLNNPTMIYQRKSMKREPGDHRIRVALIAKLNDRDRELALFPGAHEQSQEKLDHQRF